jgi:hypothetical protein
MDEGESKSSGNQGIICSKKDMCKALNYCPPAHTHAPAVQSLLVIGWKLGSSPKLLP